MIDLIYSHIKRVYLDWDVNSNNNNRKELFIWSFNDLLKFVFYFFIEEDKCDFGAFNGITQKGRFVHALQLIDNPMAMDEFSLDDVDTVISEYDVADCGSFGSESMAIS